MRKLAALLGVALLAPAIAFVAGSGVAQAQCPGNDGTIPGTSDRVIPVSAAGQTFYIDDRDFLDLDDDNDAGGLWVYRESNGTANLQRGGDQTVFATLAANGVNPRLPRVNPIPVLPPDPNRPVRPQGLTLFPNGFLGGSLAEATGFHDDCVQSSRPDQIFF